MTRLVQFANNVTSRLASGVTSSATSITVTTGDGSKFPSLTGSNYFMATLLKDDGQLEIVKVTARSGDVLTVTRAQESTAATAFSTNDRVEMRLTAGALSGEIDRLEAAAIATIHIDNFTGSGTAGPFTLSGNPGSKENTDLYIGGVYQHKSTYTLSGTSLTAGDVILSGVPIEVRWVSTNPVGVLGDQNGNVYAPAAGATNMTNGFVYIPSASGAPSGVPTVIAGKVPMYFDAAASQLYVYTGGAWKKVTLT